ncbi:MAG: hypothetical protein AAFP69_23405, partial [Planctomycetota bacterium]
MTLRTGSFLTSRAFATLAAGTELASGQPASGAQTLQALDGAQKVNLLLKSLPERAIRPVDATWGEIFDEALGLLNSNRINQAETKLRQLDRSNPSQPAILSSLLHCAIWQAKSDEQTTLLQQLGACDSLDLETRARYLAIGAALDEERVGVAAKRLIGEIDNADEASAAMTADANIMLLPQELLRQIANSEIPPRAAFHICDREIPGGEELPSTDEIPRTRAMVLLFGKQTDRDARIEVAGLFEENEEVVVQQLQRVLGPIRWQDDAADSYTVPLSAYAIVSVPPLRITSDSGALQQLNRDLISADLVDRVVDAKLAFLDGKSLRDAASDPQLDLARTGLVRMLESATEWQGTPDNWLEKVREIANVSAQDPIRPTTGEQAELLRNDQLPLVDVSNLVMTDMMFMMSRAARVGCI